MTKQISLRHLFVLGLVFISPVDIYAQQNKTIERWRIFELNLKGPADGNPFADISFYAAFTHGEKKISADGFYDGNGNYIIRFMPTEEGEWKYTTYSGTAVLNGKQGS